MSDELGGFGGGAFGGQKRACHIMGIAPPGKPGLRAQRLAQSR